MKTEVDTRIVVAAAVVVVLLLLIFAWRKFGGPANGTAISPDQAGLGKPVYPAIPGSAHPPINGSK